MMVEIKNSLFKQNEIISKTPEELEREKEERLFQEFKKYDPENNGFISSEKLKVLLSIENPSLTEEQFAE